MPLLSPGGKKEFSELIWLRYFPIKVLYKNKSTFYNSVHFRDGFAASVFLSGVELVALFLSSTYGLKSCTDFNVFIKYGTPDSSLNLVTIFFLAICTEKILWIFKVGPLPGLVQKASATTVTKGWNETN